MTFPTPRFETRLAASDADLRAAERLRYRVFVEELGGDGPMVDHAARLERDEFDPVVDHLLLVDTARDPAALDHVVGVYRLMPQAAAERFGRFYCDAEYDLTPLRASGRRLLELGRSCMDADHRGGPGLFILWNALAEYVAARDIEVLFGVASFHGTDLAALAAPLSWLHQNHLAPEGLRPRAHAAAFQRMDLIAPEALDRRAALAGLPPLIKAYLRLGGVVGEGAFVDRPFNTTDVLLLMDTARMSVRHRDFYQSRRAAPEDDAPGARLTRSRAAGAGRPDRAFAAEGPAMPVAPSPWASVTADAASRTIAPSPCARVSAEAASRAVFPPSAPSPAPAP